VVSFWENSLIQQQAALGHGPRAKPTVWEPAADFATWEMMRAWSCPTSQHGVSRMGSDLLDLKIDFDIKDHFEAAR